MKHTNTTQTAQTNNAEKKKSSILLLVAIVMIVGGLAGMAVGGYLVYRADTNTAYDSDEFDEDEYDDDAFEDDTISLASTIGGENCTLPTEEFIEHAFSIGVPAGWIHEVGNDTIAIMEDDRNLTAVFIYTAKLEQNLSAAEFLREFGNVFQSIIEDGGGRFSLGESLMVGDTATADAQATVEEGDVQGVFAVDKAGGFVTLRVYWAPVAEFASKEDILKEVADCFTRHTIVSDSMISAAASSRLNESGSGAGTANLIPQQGRYFSYAIPATWKVLAETDAGIDLEGPNAEAAVSVTYVTGAEGPIANRDWAERSLGNVGISAQLGATQSIVGIDENHTVEAYDFTGTLGGNAVNGKVTVGMYNVYAPLATYSSPFSGIQVALAGRWEQYRATTQAIQDSITITDIGARKDIKLPSGNRIEDVGGSAITSSYEYQQEVGDRSSNNWADAMRGYDTVESPSTGDRIDAPLNSWNPHGPEGEGYYRGLPGGGVEKLDPVE
jgi:hypothetical protein